jgi:glycosyltransferase involved in cell wall biosynthesis
MKVVILALSGDLSRACERLATRYPDASIETVSRSEIETGSLTERLGLLRSRRPDVFVIATERLAWQRGQNLFMLFGALAGAREVLMIDAHGGLLRKSRGSLLFGAPARLSQEAILSASVFARARRQLLRLETQVKQAAPVVPHLSTSPKIVYLRSTPGPGTQAGGAASHIKGVVEALCELGAQVDVISNDQLAGFNEDKAPLTVVAPHTSGGTRALFDIQHNFGFTRGALPLIERAQPDLIYQRYARFGWTGVVATLRTRRPLFLEYNGSEVWVGRHWDHVGRLDLLERFEKLNLSAATRIFVVSEVERRNLEKLGIDHDKIIVNPNGVDTDLFRPGVAGQRVRADLHISDGEVVVGFVGSFGPWHGVLELAKAIKTIPPATPLRFLLVGAGSLQAEMQALLAEDYASGRVIFTGAVEHSRVPSLLDACDILVAPHVQLTDGSEFFGSPTKLFEYMAMGKAIVASRLGQIGEVLEHEETALLVEPGNVGELSATIVSLVGNSALRQRLGTNAREVAIQSHTWRQNAQRVLAAYASLSLVSTNSG